MKNVIIDYRTSQKTAKTLQKLKYNVVYTPKLNSVYTTICGHGDIMVFPKDSGEIIVEPTVLNYFEKYFSKIISGNTVLRSKYPFDIAYNSALVGKNLICNQKYTDSEILRFAKKNDIKIIDTKQGYAKCSICIVAEAAIITSDKGIAKIAEQNQIDVLLIDDSDVKLDGFEHGFFGGATGLLENKLLGVNGNLERHRNCKKIIDFCENYGVSVLSLNNDEITDIGSIIAL